MWPETVHVRASRVKLKQVDIVTSSYYGFPEQQRTQQRTQQGTQQRTQQRTHSARTWVVILVLLVLGHQEL